MFQRPTRYGLTLMISDKMDNDKLYGLYMTVATLDAMSTSVKEILDTSGRIGCNNSAIRVIETKG
ncbi:dehydrogenases [Bacillus sp. OxB-1]|nr:dehydrogenases [Bacillus sp. OxB-1]